MEAGRDGIAGGQVRQGQVVQPGSSLLTAARQPETRAQQMVWSAGRKVIYLLTSVCDLVNLFH